MLSQQTCHLFQMIITNSSLFTKLPKRQPPHRPHPRNVRRRARWRDERLPRSIWRQPTENSDRSVPNAFKRSRNARRLRDTWWSIVASSRSNVTFVTNVSARSITYKDISCCTLANVHIRVRCAINDSEWGIIYSSTNASHIKYFAESL